MSEINFLTVCMPGASGGLGSIDSCGSGEPPVWHVPHGLDLRKWSTLGLDERDLLSGQNKHGLLFRDKTTEELRNDIDRLEPARRTSVALNLINVFTGAHFWNVVKVGLDVLDSQGAFTRVRVNGREEYTFDDVDVGSSLCDDERRASAVIQMLEILTTATERCFDPGITALLFNRAVTLINNVRSLKHPVKGLDDRALVEKLESAYKIRYQSWNQGGHVRVEEVDALSRMEADFQSVRRPITGSDTGHRKNAV